jgi:hypothetical protein
VLRRTGGGKLKIRAYKWPFAEVAGSWPAAGWLASRSVGQGVAHGHGPIPGTTAISSGPIPEARLPQSLAEICAQSGGFVPAWPARHETSLIRRAGRRQRRRREAFPSRELWKRQVIYHALMRLAIIL